MDNGRRRSDIAAILAKADAYRADLGTLHDLVIGSIYVAAGQVAAAAVSCGHRRRWNWEQSLDRLVTSRWFGLPFMLGMLALVFWLTIAAANVPSSFLAGLLIEEGGLSGWVAEYLGLTLPAALSFSLYELLHMALGFLPAPVTGLLVDGVYLGLAWVVSVMLPPMAIFFPLFTFMEDLGLLPRLAFNMDRFLRAAGAHGKQALTMAMGFGCNAAGVIACRIIDSPRERLIAILTNNFVPCNGRWPTLIMIASLFLAAGFSGWMTGVVAVGSLMAVTLLGVATTLAVSFFLSRTLLRGVASSFTLEMPPYRPPQLGRILYTSLIDRTLFVLRRAIVCAAPAGAVIWLMGAIPAGEGSLYQLFAGALDPLGRAMVDAWILAAFIIAIPANEIIIPTIIMGYMPADRKLELDIPIELFSANGWTMLTGVCLMLFSLLHWPCTTTTLTIWAETRSVKWTVLSNLIPTALAFAVCFLVATVWRAVG